MIIRKDGIRFFEDGDSVYFNDTSKFGFNYIMQNNLKILLEKIERLEKLLCADGERRDDDA